MAVPKMDVVLMNDISVTPSLALVFVPESKFLSSDYANQVIEQNTSGYTKPVSFLFIPLSRTSFAQITIAANSMNVDILQLLEVFHAIYEIY